MAAAKTGGLMPQLKAFINSPTGPRTTHFWGPVANWGFVVAVRDGPAAQHCMSATFPDKDAQSVHCVVLLLKQSCLPYRFFIERTTRAMGSIPGFG